MKIIFFWIKDENFYDTLYVAFGGKYDIKVEENEQDLRLRLLRHDEYGLPNKFFSVSNVKLRKSQEKDRSFVDSVSVVAGKNASGKTSIARYLEAVRSNGDCDNLGFDYVLIYETEEEEWTIQASKGGKRIDKDIVENIDESVGIRWRYGAHARDDFFFIYYSPHYTTEDPFFPDDGAMFNVSTSSLMGHRQEADLGVLALNVDQEFVISNFMAHEHSRVLEFSQTCMSRNLGDDLNIRLPKAVRIWCNLRSAQELNSWVESCGAALEMEIDNAKTPEEKFEIKRLSELALLCKDLAKVTKKVLFNESKGWALSKNGNFVLNVFCVYLLAYAHTIDFVNNKFDFIRSWYLKRLVNWAKQTIPDFLSSNCDNPFRFYDSLLKCLEDNISLNLPKYPGNIAETPADAIPRKHMFEVFRWVVNMCKNQPEERQSTIRYLEINARNTDFMAVVGHLAQCHTRVDVLTFSFFPVLSSGEMSFVSMMSRLWYAISRLVSLHNNNTRKFFITLDEVETTLHPDWQRKIVHWVIQFLEYMPEGNHFHLLFLTHSPILLSDVPITNACFLDRLEGMNGASLRILRAFQTDSHIQLKDTFAANIFDLYHSSFFLREGLVGKFAQDKIDALLRKLTPMFRATRYGYHTKVVKAKKTKVKLTKEERVIIDLVGDPFVSAYLRNRADALGLLDGSEAEHVED